MMNRRKPLRAAVDLDGTIARYGPIEKQDRSIIGPLLPGAREFLSKLREVFDEVVLFTCRTCPEVSGSKEAAASARKLIASWVINNKLDDLVTDLWLGDGKIEADVYFDDRGIACAPQLDGPKAYDKALAAAGAMLLTREKAK